MTGIWGDNLDLLFLAIEAVSVPVPITALCRLLVGDNELSCSKSGDRSRDD